MTLTSPLEADGNGLPDIADPAAPRPAVAPRLLALDLDGTCIDDRQQLHPRTRSAIRSAARRLDVVLATGRMYWSAVRWARELQLRSPLICYQGAMVRRLPSGYLTGDAVEPGELLLEVPLPPEPTSRAIELARAHGWHRQAYRDECLLCEEDRPEAHLYARIANVEINFVDDLVAAVPDGTIKVVCVVDDRVAVAECEDSLAKGLGASARVVRSLPPFVEITNPVATKGRALAELRKQLGIGTPDEVVAIGDAPNDIDLFKEAGFAVAVAHAGPKVVSYADALCAEPEAGGVADVLEALGLT
ncbi:MAG TPA: HAD hydrolase family protein [Candidatus Sulfotelmatobacter sp.]|nr:HAD hydrolase family protein [Candidatus Sulfotelmatobacter sp.]